MKSHSYAPSGAGTDDPESVVFFDVEDEQCGINSCTQETCDHFVLMWTGNEYSHNHTWLTAEPDAVLDLEEVR